MCGLVGFLADSPMPRFEERCASVVKAMLQAITHRGNDGEGVFFSANGQCALGHRRLAIVRQDDLGLQPMTSADGRYTLVFNGEIYNYKALAQELESRGLFGHTGTDTEVLLLGFSVWGTAFFSRLNGMFAVVIWDSVEQRAFFVRDHFGIKPLYWTRVHLEGQGGILFASEIKALLATGLVQRKIDKQGLAEYLQYGVVHAPLTMVENVGSLEPASYMIVQNGESRQDRFWDISSIQTRFDEQNLDELVASVREKFINACQLYSNLNLDLGIFLSGGIDSTALLAVCSKLLGKKVQTFSLGFVSPTASVVDESFLAQKTALAFGSDHYDLQVDAYMARLAFEPFVAAIDQPSSDGFNTFLISRFAGEHVKVVLSGLGGDEVFLGYRFFGELLRLLQIDQVPKARQLSNLLAACMKSSRVFSSLMYNLGLGILKHGDLRGQELYATYRSLPGDVDVARFLHFDIRSKMMCASQAKSGQLQRIFSSEKDMLNAFSKAELSWYVPGVLARDTDAASMASTIETRVPFLDIDLVEFVVGLPSSYKRSLEQKTNKPLFVRAFQDILPQDVVAEKKKGFEMPIGFWLKQNFKDHVEVLKECDWVDEREIEILCSDLHRDPREYRRLWSLLVLAEWKELHGMSM